MLEDFLSRYPEYQDFPDMEYIDRRLFKFFLQPITNR